jgi:hypothetical protein
VDEDVTNRKPDSWGLLWAPFPLRRRLTPNPNEGREARFMVLTIEPSLIPSLERSFNGEVKKAAIGVSLETNAPDDFSVTGARLIFRGKIILEQRKAWSDS